MTAADTLHSSKYGLMSAGKTYEIDESDASAFEARGYLTRSGGTKMDEAPLNKAAPAPANKAEPAPAKRKRPVTDEGPILTTGSVTTPDKGAE